MVAAAHRSAAIGVRRNRATGRCGPPASASSQVESVERNTAHRRVGRTDVRYICTRSSGTAVAGCALLAMRCDAATGCALADCGCAALCGDGWVRDCAAAHGVAHESHPLHCITTMIVLHSTGVRVLHLAVTAAALSLRRLRCAHKQSDKEKNKGKTERGKGEEGSTTKI